MYNSFIVICLYNSRTILDTSWTIVEVEADIDADIQEHFGSKLLLAKFDAAIAAL